MACTALMSKISTQSYAKAARREPRITNKGVLAANLPNSAASMPSIQARHKMGKGKRLGIHANALPCWELQASCGASIIWGAVKRLASHDRGVVLDRLFHIRLHLDLLRLLRALGCRSCSISFYISFLEFVALLVCGLVVDGS